MATVKISSSHDLFELKRYKFSTKSFLTGVDLVGFNSLFPPVHIGCAINGSKYKSIWGNLCKVRLKNGKIGQIEAISEYQLTNDLTARPEKIDLRISRSANSSDESSKNGTKIDKNEKNIKNRFMRISKPIKQRNKNYTRSKRQEEINSTNTQIDSVLSSITPDCTIEKCNSILMQLEKSNNHNILQFFDWMRQNNKLEKNTDAYQLVFRALARREDWYKAESLLKEMISISNCELNVKLFNSLIYICSKRGLDNWGTKWYGIMLESKLVPNIATIGMLMSLYQKTSNVLQAEFIFNQMRDYKIDCVKAYSNMITIYTRLGMFEKSEEIIYLMEKDNVVPDLENWLVRVNMYSQQGKLDKAELVLESMKNIGISPNIIAYNTLITGFGKISDMKSAKRVFNSLKSFQLVPDESTFRSMIEGFGRIDDYKEAFWYYKELKRLGFKPNSSNYYTMINLQARHKDEIGTVETLNDMHNASCHISTIVGKLIQAHERTGTVVRILPLLEASFYKKVLFDPTSCSMLAVTFVKNSLLDQAFRVLNEKKWKESYNYEDNLYHLLICTCKEDGRFEDAIRVYDHMLETRSNPNPNIHIACTMIDVFTCAEKFAEAEGLYVNLKDLGVKLDLIAYNVVIRMYIKADKLKEACLVMETIEENKNIIPDIYLFRDMLRTYQKCEMEEKLLTTYYWIRKTVDNFDESMYNCVINCCACVLPVDELLRLFDEMTNNGFRANIITLNSLLDVFGRARLFNKANKIFNIAFNQGLANVISYNTMISSYAQARDFEKMNSTIQKMQNAGFDISLEVYNCLLDTYGKENMLEEFESVLRKMKGAKCKFDHYTYNIMINIYARNGWIEAVSEVFKELRERGLEPDLYSYNTLIKAYGIARMPEEAVNLMREMRSKKVNPDRITYMNLITALQRNENYLEAVKWSLWMKQLNHVS
ncbi:hypothetical protein LUZ60_002890 [Juncus effusus]|nr:hypothetical protein LUZ60_002890 [Juncus effusus]